MPLDIHLKPVETLLYRSDLVAVGKFRCPSTHALFRDSGPCSHHTFVFPRTMTGIRHEEGTSFVGTPNGIAFYNQHQLYSRTAISDIDASDWYTVADDALLDVIRRYDPSVDERPSRPFLFAEVASDATTFLLQRRLFDDLAAGCGADIPVCAPSADRNVCGTRCRVDRLHVDETVLRVLDRAVARAYGRRAADATDADAVEHAKTILARRLTENVSLRELARECHVSPFRLCRMFRARTGETLTWYRHALRLRVALDRLRDHRADLSALAHDLGFSSHSHFTAVFRRHFGVPPSRARI